MNIAIQRHGILIRTVEIESDAKIGSAPDCEIALDDSYLAPHVADIAKRGEEWFIVDSGQSLEGVSRNGVRIDDEPLRDREVYLIGGFELVPHFPTGWASVTDPDATYRLDFPKTMMETDAPDAAAFPSTMAEAGDRQVPPTMFETPTPDPIGDAQPSPRPITAAAAAQIAPRATGPKRLLRIIMVALAAAILLLLLAIVVGDDEKETTPSVATETAAPVAPAAPKPASAAELEQRGTTLVAALDYAGGLAQWEAAISAGAPPALREKYATVASDVANVHAAAHDATNARTYFEKVVKYGPPESPVVLAAKARLQQ